MNAAEVCNTNCNKVKVSNSGDSNSISEADVDVVQSPNDKRKYKVVVLDNGLRVLLISDLNSDPESSSECEKPCQDEQKNEDISESETDETADDVSDMEQDAIPSDGGKQECVEDGEKLAAAALCVGVGSFSDPPDIPGLAHFLEHMVFMGSEKYPDENAFDSFVRKHGGNNNACTDCERTTFCFDIERKHLKDALDIFAQFFISPLLKENSVDREINAVDSEFDMSKTSNSVIKQQLFGSLGKKGIPMGKFMWGNIESLKETPSTKGIDLYENLQIFHRHYYSAHFMTLCVQAKVMNFTLAAPLDLMQSWVTEIFSDIPNNKTTQPSFYHVSDSFNTPDFTKLYQVVPVKNTNQLSLTWHMPCLRHLYRCKPLHYVGWLCGHEGSGSILSYLKKKSWALTVVAGNAESGWEHNSTGALFEVNITLTDEGLRNYEEVIKVVFEYLTLLREVGASVQIYNQIKLVEDNDFRWKEKVDPWDYAEHLAEAMQLYEPVDYLRGSTVLYDWTDECKFSIESVIHKLLPSNCNIMVLSPSFEAQADREEYWYKTKYLVKEVPQSLRDPTAFRPRRQLHLPPPNDFIASDFSLKDPNTLYTKEPKLILNTSRSKLWYKQDRKFKVPKVCVYFHILSPVVSTSAKSQALLDLFLDILSHNLVEVAYNAYVAQLEYEFKATNEGIIIKLRGFSHKLHKLMEIIMDRIDEFDVSDQDFHTLNEQLKKNYYNSFIKPEKLARDVRLMLLENKSWTKVHKRAFLANLRKVDLMNFVSEFKRMSHIEGYVHGNYTVEEALNMESCVRNRLRNDALPQAMLPVERVTQLPVDDSVVRVKSFHEGTRTRLS
ncbi:NRD1 [Bugula neritina]|uniref:NRD1 n=1 Tax=Bugula neritina TaxID=10212 RepID=A0A7J7K9H9_BUGNE|nr:NRD1 [Bugula neritina]